MVNIKEISRRKFIFGLSAVLLTGLVAGCTPKNSVEYTKTATLSEDSPSIKESDIEFGMYPAVYEVNNYKVGKLVDLKYTLYNDLDYSTLATVSIYLPSITALNKNPEYKGWGLASAYCNVVDEDLTIPANGKKDITVSIYVPDDETPPDKWMFYVAYQSEGHKWGRYVITDNKNFVFLPHCFSCDITDNEQKMSWLTWGNSPEIMVRAKYDLPPENINDGNLIYQGIGTQVIKKWQDPDTGKILDRQYTSFDITDNKILTWNGGDKLFYRAWQKNIVNGKWDNTWNLIGQSLVIPEVQAKVLVNMK